MLSEGGRYVHDSVDEEGSGPLRVQSLWWMFYEVVSFTWETFLVLSDGRLLLCTSFRQTRSGQLLVPYASAPSPTDTFPLA